MNAPIKVVIFIFSQHNQKKKRIDLAIVLYAKKITINILNMLNQKNIRQTCKIANSRNN